MLKDIHIDDSSEIVDITDENVFLATSDQRIKGSTVCEGIKDIAVSGRIPRLDRGIVFTRNREEGFFDDSGESRLIESENVNIVALIFLNDALGVVFSVERVHQDKRDITAPRAI